MKGLSIKYLSLSTVLPPFQIVSHSKNVGELEYLNFDQNYREKL